MKRQTLKLATASVVRRPKPSLVTILVGRIKQLMTLKATLKKCRQSCLPTKISIVGNYTRFKTTESATTELFTHFTSLHCVQVPGNVFGIHAMITALSTSNCCCSKFGYLEMSFINSRVGKTVILRKLKV